MTLSGYDRETLHIVIEDLEDLFSEFGGVEYKGSKLRKSSSTLNMLLVENSLLNAYKIIYGKTSSPVIAAPNLDLYLDADEDRKIVCAVAGGATFLTHEVALVMLGGAGNRNFYHAEDYKFNFTSYLNGTSFFFDGHRISREVIIKYIANKRGGKHLDFKRKGSKLDNLYEILDKRADFFNFFGKSGLFVELHAIIQAMQKSNDIRKFMRDGKKIIVLT